MLQRWWAISRESLRRPTALLIAVGLVTGAFPTSPPAPSRATSLNQQLRLALAAPVFAATPPPQASAIRQRIAQYLRPLATADTGLIQQQLRSDPAWGLTHHVVPPPSWIAPPRAVSTSESADDLGLVIRWLVIVEGAVAKSLDAVVLIGMAQELDASVRRPARPFPDEQEPAPWDTSAAAVLAQVYQGGFEPPQRRLAALDRPQLFRRAPDGVDYQLPTWGADRFSRGPPMGFRTHVI